MLKICTPQKPCVFQTAVKLNILQLLLTALRAQLFGPHRRASSFLLGIRICVTVILLLQLALTANILVLIVLHLDVIQRMPNVVAQSSVVFPGGRTLRRLRCR